MTVSTTDVTNAVATLTQAAAYLNALQSTATLQNDATKLNAAVDPTDLVAQPAITDITTAYSTIFSNPLGQPNAIGGEVTNAVTTLNTYIAQLQDQIVSLMTTKTITVAPPAPVPAPSPVVVNTAAPKMSTTAFIIGVASVAAIGGGVWWMAQNARKKGIENYAMRKKAARAAKEA